MATVNFSVPGEVRDEFKRATTAEIAAARRLGRP